MVIYKPTVTVQTVADPFANAQLSLGKSEKELRETVTLTKATNLLVCKPFANEKTN